MKSVLLCVFTCVLLYANTWAQAPNELNYQAVVRNSSGLPEPDNTPVSITFTIHDGSVGGAVEFSETQSLTTNSFGLINTQIGAVNSALDTVNWGGSTKFLDVQIQVNGGTLTDIGTTQMVSVPYSLYAGGSANVSGTLDYVAKFTPNGTWVGNSLIYDNGTGVGIGTNTPNSPLEVSTSDTSINAISCYSVGNVNGTSWGPSDCFAGLHGEAGASYAQYQAGVYGYVQGYGPNSGGVVGAYTSGIWGALGYVDADTGNWGVYSNGNEYINGSIGVGTLKPTGKVEVYHTSSLSSPQLDLYDIGSTNFARLEFNNASGSTYWQIAGLNSATNSEERLNFFNSTTGNILSITGNGYVGIGTTSPATTLNVVSGKRVTALASTDTLVGSFSAAVFNPVTMPIAILGQYTGAGEYDGVGVYGTALADDANYGEGVIGEGNYVGVAGIAHSGAFAAIYAQSDTAEYALFASGGPTALYGNTYVSGNLQYTGTLTGPSDIKLKKDISPIQNALNAIMQLKPASYQFRVGEFGSMYLPEGKHYGVISEDLQTVFPELVTKTTFQEPKGKGKDKNSSFDYLSVNYTELIPVLIKGMQEQQQTIQAQQQTIEQLKTAVEQLKNK